jgi:hypothetical protein
MKCACLESLSPIRSRSSDKWKGGTAAVSVLSCVDFRVKWRANSLRTSSACTVQLNPVGVCTGNRPFRDQPAPAARFLAFASAFVFAFAFAFAFESDLRPQTADLRPQQLSFDGIRTTEYEVLTSSEMLLSFPGHAFLLHVLYGMYHLCCESRPIPRDFLLINIIQVL